MGTYFFALMTHRLDRVRPTISERAGVPCPAEDVVAGADDVESFEIVDFSIRHVRSQALNLVTNDSV